MPETYLARTTDSALAELVAGAPAVVVQGARGVGKTSSAARLAKSVLAIDDPLTVARLSGDPRGFLEAQSAPVLVDEWQNHPPVWDAVRRSIDATWSPGRYILTGSANPRGTRVHTGAGRFVWLRMRPLSFAERALTAPTVSVSALLNGGLSRIEGESPITFDNYVDEVAASGFPGIRAATSERVRSALLRSYTERAVDVEVPELGVGVRRPNALRTWLRAYAGATSTTASIQAISLAVPEELRPSRTTVAEYTEALRQLWLLDEVPAWHPGGPSLRKLGSTPKRQLADPALALSLIGVSAAALMSQGDQALDRSTRALVHRTALGALFESLVTLSVRVYADAAEADLGHLRTHAGEHEIDLIVARPDGGVIAIEVKLHADVDDRDVRHLHWLRDRIGDQLVDAVVVTTGPYAYRREDGVAVVPLALLGP